MLTAACVYALLSLSASLLGWRLVSINKGEK